MNQDEALVALWLTRKNITNIKKGNNRSSFLITIIDHQAFCMLCDSSENQFKCNFICSGKCASRLRGSIKTTDGFRRTTNGSQTIVRWLHTSLLYCVISNSGTRNFGMNEMKLWLLCG